MRGLICRSIPALFVFSLECMSRSSQHSEKSSHSPKRMLSEVLRRSDNCLKEIARATRTKESSPLRSFQSVQNFDNPVLETALVLPDNSSPREQEISSSPKKLFPSIIARSNSRRHLINPKTSKESSTQASPRISTAQGSHQPPTQEDLIDRELEKEENELKKFLRKKMKKAIAKINAGKIKPITDLAIPSAPYRYCPEPFAKHYVFTHMYKNTRCILHFIQCSKGNIGCFIDCPLLYA